AYERVVDRLLASSAYGERWAQHWLDLAHYADSNGFELDADRPDAWRYRDWVIQAFNEDMPYDEFLRWQIAGDEAEPGNVAALIASGFGRSGPREVVSGNIDPEERRQSELVSVTSTVGSVFMGLTLGCARCHDHKFDPFPTEDYYRLQACFAGVELSEVPIHDEKEKEGVDRETARIKALIKPIAAKKSALEEPYKKRLKTLKEANLTERERAVRAKSKKQRTPEEQRLFEGTNTALRVTWEEIAESVFKNRADHLAREVLKRQIHELQLQLPRPPAHAMAMIEKEPHDKLPETPVLRRGNVKLKGDPVQPAPPLILAKEMGRPETSFQSESPLDEHHSGRRLALAKWLTDPSHPLTSRVMVNRLWQHHFGRGIVATASDFGVRGEAPVNQALLDWLASELIRSGWSLKTMHRLMVTSEAYRRSSGAISASGLERDPENQMLWRMNRRRMEAEGFRDAILMVSGLMNRRAGGAGVHPPLEPEVRELIFTEAEVVDLWPVDTAISEHGRRSIYLHRKRNVHYPMFDAFDAPDAQTPCPQRTVSTHAPQALVMLNSGFAQGAARSFSHQLLSLAGTDDDRIRESFLRCYAREPDEVELIWAREFVALDGRPAEERWMDFALALLNSSEFVYVK
ncbi:DUF1549 and DUF1553 domain-containing protein, partial [Verrucomicrobia bacterium]|nr:DUF1549 and DUF1553 domain-containing protein [Verrucomicrobiota bacterium]